MSKNILVLSSSPRKGGNSDLLCDEFLRGARVAGHDGEKIRLSEKNINYCTGCCACISQRGACVQRDDMAEIHEKLLACDVMVLATPVYFHSMNGQLKTLIDRVCPIYTMLKDKDVYFVVAAAGGETLIERTAQSLRVFTDCLENIREKGVISVTGVWDVGQVKKTEAMYQAYRFGKGV
ncbi:MAG: NADPH-dependent FMN reductase [Desulfuromonas sp.]|nr:MAG: NADPH-dependent FMN reductase [Desulfuromonas sp.]